MSQEILRKLSARQYGYVIAVVSLLGLQNYSFAYFTQMPARNKAFTNEFMKTNFEEFHKSHMGQNTEAPGFGYPDMGAGYYSRALNYKEWYNFNCA